MKSAFKNLFFHFKSHQTNLFLGCFISSTCLFYHNSKPQMEQLNSSTVPKHYPKISEEKLQKVLQKYPLLTVYNNEKSHEYIMSHLRDKTTSCSQFRYYADRFIRLLLESAISKQDLKYLVKESPLGTYDALETKTPLSNFCAVTILRAGNSFLKELLHLFPEISIGQILIQRNEESREKEPIFYYSKLPKNIKNMKVLLCDPMIGTGGSICAALKHLKERGVKEEDIDIIALIGCSEGIEKIYQNCPKVKMMVGCLDEFLIPDSKYIAPGLGDFGDRYFGTF